MCESACWKDGDCNNKKMNKNCYIFLKWSLTNNSCAGGGTFMPPQQVTIETTT